MREKWKGAFPNPKLVTLDTPHEPNTKFLKKCPKMREQ